MRATRAIPLALLLAVVVRVPFWIEALRTPVDGDTAVIGLMARHLGEGTTMWGQPYGSPLDSWVAWPFVALWGGATEALRVPYFLLALGLVPLAYGLARTLDPAAAFPAAVLLACPPPYFLLLSALPPPLYPTSLLLCGLVLLLAARAGQRLEEASGDGHAPRGSLLLAGLLSGIALWTHLMSASAVLAAAGWLFVRARRRRLLLAWALLPLLAASAPLWTRLAQGAQAARILQFSDRQESAAAHLSSVLPRLYEPLGGILGTHVPVIADSEDFVLHAPGWVAGTLVLLYGLILILAVRATRSRHPSMLFLIVAGLTVLAFPFPLRAAPHTIRFLTPLYLPVAALVVWVAASRGRGRRAWVLVLALAALHLIGGTRLLAAWRTLDRSEAPFLLQDLAPVRRLLRERRVRHAYASYGPAFRLTFESEERIVASPPWNDRFRHWPLPLLDEVRFAKNVAWVLTPDVPSALPTAEALESALRALGGRWRREELADAVIIHGFVPPFSPRVRPWPGGGSVGDSDLRTFLEPEPSVPLVLRLPHAQALEAVTLLAAFDGPRLPRSVDVEASADGEHFEVVVSRRRRQEREDLRWVNGQPQAVIDHDVIAIGLGGRTVSALRIAPWRSGDAWRLGEVLLHVEPGRDPWDEWLAADLGWEGRRRALVEQPRPNREDWYSRILLAGRHRPIP